MLHNKNPREQSGRDTFSRYKAQARSAAMASLSILEGKEIDRVYCDLHDDFVVRVNSNDKVSYIFYQVKTKNKQNHNWSIGELFGLKKNLKDQSKQDPNKIRDSFIGKLLLHTIVFDDSCSFVCFQTNIHNSDEVEELHRDIADGIFENKFTKVLIDKFNTVFSEELDSDKSINEIKERLSKLKFHTDVQYLKIGDDNFEPLARNAIYEFSEVDLEYSESREILMKLLNLVEQKSTGVISKITSEEIEKSAGISIGDLLSILSLSQDAYEILLAGGDSHAIKSTSIIQRTLSGAGASSEEVAYCSRCKTNWDLWLRRNRHVIPEFDLQAISSSIKELLNLSAGNGREVSLIKLRDPIKDLAISLKSKEILYDLDLDLILGAVFSELVKGKS